MRWFETGFLVLFILSYANLVVVKSKKAGILLPAAAIAACLLSRLTEGFRSHIIPALLLTALLLVQSSLRALFRKEADESKKSKWIRNVIFTVILTPIITVSVAFPFLFPVAALPEPGGPYPVGTTRMAFRDTTRKDWLSETEQNRNVPIQMWYPASDTAGRRRANWLGSRKAIRLFAESRHLPDLFDQLTLVKTNSYEDAPLSNKEEKYPVILFSGGGAMFNGQNVIQMEELASRGYIVFAAGHPYEDFACLYPSGTILPYNQKQAAALSADTAKAVQKAKQLVSGESNPEFSRAILRNALLTNESVREWSRDMSSALDMAYKQDSGEIPGIFEGKLDLKNVGAFGHSFGGAASGQLCLQDDRIKAFINMDGSPFGDAPDKEIQQPFLILTVDGTEKYNIRNGYSKKEDNFIVVKIKGAEHMNFSDINTLMPALGKLAGFLGGIGTERQEEIMNDYIVNFFDLHLKGKPSDLLNGPATKYPEVNISAY